MIIARGASAVARRESRSHSPCSDPIAPISVSLSRFSGGVTSQGRVESHSAAPRLPRAWCQGATLRRRGPKRQAAKGEARRGAKSARAGRALLQCPQFPRCNHAKSCVEAQRRAERDASCRIEYDSGQSRGSRDLSGGAPEKRQYPNCLWGRRVVVSTATESPWSGIPCFLPDVIGVCLVCVPAPPGVFLPVSRPRGAVDSGLAAVLAAVESVAVFVRVCVFGFGWMVVRFVRVIRVPACARVSRVSRVCPGSPRCLFTGIRTGTGPVHASASDHD